MAVRIAIPEPTSDDPEYNQRALPQYLEAVKAAGAESVVVPDGEAIEPFSRLIGSKNDAQPGAIGDTLQRGDRT